MTDRCPDCPDCGHPPRLRVSDHQAFCGNDDCRCVMWNPTRTRAQNMADPVVVSLDWTDGGDPA